jgi:hypothetical protein
MTHGNYLPNLANYAHKYIRGDGTMSKIGLRPRKERGVPERKHEHAQQTQSPKNNAKIMKGGVLTSTIVRGYIHHISNIARVLWLTRASKAMVTWSTLQQGMQLPKGEGGQRPSGFVWCLAADGNQTMPLVLGKGRLGVVSTKYTLYHCPRVRIKNVLGYEQLPTDLYRKSLKIAQ